MGYLKGKSALMMFDKHANLKYKFGNRHFWAEGYYVMSDDWFTEYTYQVVVNKKYLTAQQVEELAQEPIQLEPWDPMGSLA